MFKLISVAVLAVSVAAQNALIDGSSSFWHITGPYSIQTIECGHPNNDSAVNYTTQALVLEPGSIAHIQFKGTFIDYSSSGGPRDQFVWTPELVSGWFFSFWPADKPADPTCGWNGGIGGGNAETPGVQYGRFVALESPFTIGFVQVTGGEFLEWDPTHINQTNVDAVDKARASVGLLVPSEGGSAKSAKFKEELNQPLRGRVGKFGEYVYES